MTKNIHSVERVIRIGIGIALMPLAFFGPENYWFLLAGIPLLTGVLGWCPPYQILGINTCKVKTK